MQEQSIYFLNLQIKLKNENRKQFDNEKKHLLDGVAADVFPHRYSPKRRAALQ